jgi:hypothetical protein
MQIRQGTVNVTNGSPNVDAYDPLTDWSTVKNTDWFIVDGDDAFYSIGSVQIPGPNNTPRLVLTANYAGVTGTQLPYAIVQDFSPSQQLPLINRGDIETGAIYSRAMMILDVSYGGELDTLNTRMDTLESDMSTLQGDVTALQTGKVATTRKILTTNSIAGGGDLSADRTLQLVGDVASGTLLSYGFDASGNRGFFATPPAPLYVQKAGDTMTGSLLINTDSAGLELQTKTATNAYITLSTLGSSLPADLAKDIISIYKVSGGDRLNIQRKDNTGTFLWNAYLLDSFHKISNTELATGTAVANLGYTPVNGAGGVYAVSSGVIFQKDVGLGAASYSLAPLRTYAVTTGGRPQIGFWMPGYAASLFYHTDNRFWWIDAGGQAYAIADNVHKIDNSWLVAGTAAANLGFNPINRAGDNLLGAQLIFQRDVGLGGSSYYSGSIWLRTASANPSARAGIGFENQGVIACFLYLETNGKLRFILNNGTVHEITSN